MLTRQREGIAKGKGEGKYKGRKPTARAKSAEVLAMHRERIGATEIARKLGIGRRSVYRILDDQAGTTIHKRKAAGLLDRRRISQRPSSAVAAVSSS
jgi:DNA invertase Pin-like site-specific DNA recombinase